MINIFLLIIIIIILFSLIYLVNNKCSNKCNMERFITPTVPILTMPSNNKETFVNNERRFNKNDVIEKYDNTSAPSTKVYDGTSDGSFENSIDPAYKSTDWVNAYYYSGGTILQTDANKCVSLDGKDDDICKDKNNKVNCNKNANCKWLECSKENAKDGLCDMTYSNNYFGGETPANNPKASGADPSCGNKDWATLSTCIMGYPLLANADPSDGKNNFPYNTDRRAVYKKRMDNQMPYRSTATWAQDSVTKLTNNHAISKWVDDPKEQHNDICINCEDKETNHGPNCDGTVQFVNPTHAGKIPAIAHGIFSGPIGQATCTTDKYPTVSKQKFRKYVSQFGAIVRNCNSSDETVYKYLTNKNVGTESAPQYIGIIKPKAFIDANLEEVYNKLHGVNNGGVAIAWGHGLGEGGCGSSFFMKRGPHNGPGDPYEHNTVLLFQTGTRAWSGEWNDSFGKQTGWKDAGEHKDGKFDENMEGGKQSYIVQGAYDEENSASCVMPYMQNFSQEKLEILLDTICEVLPEVDYKYFDVNNNEKEMKQNECKLEILKGVCDCDPESNKYTECTTQKTAVDVLGTNRYGDIKRAGECALQDNTNPVICKQYAKWGCGTWREGEYGQKNTYTECSDTKWKECQNSTASNCCNKYNDSPECDTTTKWCTTDTTCKCNDPSTPEQVTGKCIPKDGSYEIQCSTTADETTCNGSGGWLDSCKWVPCSEMPGGTCPPATTPAASTGGTAGRCCTDFGGSEQKTIDTCTVLGDWAKTPDQCATGGTNAIWFPN